MNIQDGRTIFVFNSGRVEDVRRLSEKVADKLVLELFNCDGRLHWLDEAGKLTAVSTRLLADLLARHFTNVRLAARDDGVHVVEFHPVGLGQQDLIDLMDQLVRRVAVGPSKPKVLSEQKKQEIRYRLKVGEPRESVAQAYDISPADIKAVIAAA
jgi:hypothetical protein